MHVYGPYTPTILESLQRMKAFVMEHTGVRRKSKKGQAGKIRRCGDARPQSPPIAVVIFVILYFYYGRS